MKAFALGALGVLAFGLSACGDRSQHATNTAASGGYAGDVEHGRLVFATNCATCHGADGRSGGVGPSLIDENARQAPARTVVWIKDPAPPMPKLYPSPLSQNDVDDVAAFVQSIR